MVRTPRRRTCTLTIRRVAPSKSADRLAPYAESGADNITVTLDRTEWRRQLNVLAKARQLLQ